MSSEQVQMTAIPGEKVRKTWKPVVAGYLLIIFGMGIPVVSILITVISSNEQMVFFTGPMLILALWVLPIIGGFLAIKRKKFVFVFIGSIITLVYWFPIVLIIEASGAYVYNDFFYLGCLFLYLPLLMLTIPAFVLLILSKKEFKIERAERGA